MKYTVYIIVISVCTLLTGCVGAVVYNPSYLDVDLQSKPSSANCNCYHLLIECLIIILYIKDIFHYTALKLQHSFHCV